MKKFLIITSALLLLVLAFAACTGYNYPLDENGFPIFTDIFQTAPKEEPTEPAYVETDEVTPTEPLTELPTELPEETLPHEIPTDAPYGETSGVHTTEEPTEAPTEPPMDPEDPLHTVGPDFLENYASQEGNLVCNNNIGSHEVKTEGGRTFIRLTSNGGDPYIAFVDGQKQLKIGRYMAISYRTNSAKAGQFFMGSGDGWNGNGDFFRYDWNEDGNWNLAIIDLDNVGLTSLTDYILNYARMDFFEEASYEGDYIDIEYIAFFNEYEYAVDYDFEMHKPPMWHEHLDIVTHLSFDQLYFGNGSADEAINGGLDVFTPGASANWDHIADLTDAHADTLTYWGWVAIKGEVGQFGYRINKEAPIFNDDWTYPTEEPVIDAALTVPGTTTGSRYKIAIDISRHEGENTVTVLYRNPQGETVALSEFTAITPVKPKDITNTFVSDVKVNAEGTDLQDSDLAQYFNIYYGVADPHKVSNGMYQYGGINEMYADMNGLYAYVIDMQEASNTAMAFVRGTRVVHSVDLPVAENNLYLINNYFETDGLGLMGGAGIYAAIYNGQLNIVVKAYDPDCKLHIANKHYSIKADGTLLTIADNGETLYFMVEDKLLATIALSGETEYDKLCDIDPAIKFAQTAVVTLADGTTDTIRNTLVASTYAAQIGIALRPGTMKFSSLMVLGFNDVVIPDQFYRPERYENLVIPQDQWVVTGHCTEIVGKEGHNLSAMVEAAGVESAALLHQGSIYLGNLDLSKYDKVVIYWGTDNSQITIDHYNANPNNRLMLMNSVMEWVMSPDEATIIAGRTYELMGWAVTPLEIDLQGNNYSGPVYLGFDTLPGTFMLVSSIEFIGAEKSDEPIGPEAPENNNWVVDLSTIEGNFTWSEAGYGDAPLLRVGYDTIFNFGTVDLSKYSHIIVEYSYDGDNVRGDGRTPEQCFTDCPIAPIIGFTALDRSFGFANVVNQDAIDMGIHTALEYTSGSWAGATRIATINTVAYNGPLYLSVFNPWGTEIVISSVTFVNKLNDFDNPSTPEAHEHKYESVVTAPTCTEDGYTTYTCACGDSYVADEVAALGHNFADGTCTVCGKADPDYAEPDAPIGPEAPAGGAADFNTIELPADKPNGISSYTGPYTTAAGWVIENSAIQCGGATAMNPQFPVIGADNSSKAPCLNGKVNVAGKLTSPTLTGGISKLTINYTKMFTDTKLSATITITDLTTGAVYTNTLYKEAEKNDKYTVWTYDWVLETPITGDFTIEIVNDCPTGQNANKDRITILSLAWEGAAAVEPETPAVPNLTIPQDQWVVSGHCTEIVGKEGHNLSAMVEAAGVESAALLHQGSIYLGNLDLSKYDKVVIYWGSDNSEFSTDLYNSNIDNRFALVNADKNMQMSPNANTIIAAATYELHGWAVAPFEIDLTDINYSGDVYLTHDSLPGGFALVSSIEFISAEKTEEPQTPAEGSFLVTTTDTYGYFDEYTFTAGDAGVYTFTLPAGLGFYSFEDYMNWGSPIVDFYENVEGYTFSVTLAEGEAYKYLVGAIITGTWTITYTFDADGISGDTPATPDKPAGDFSGTYIAACGSDTGTVVIDTLTSSLVFTDPKGNVIKYTFDISEGVVTLSNASGPINPGLAMYFGGLELNADGTPSIFFYNGYEWVLSLC